MDDGYSGNTGSGGFTTDESGYYSTPQTYDDKMGYTSSPYTSSPSSSSQAGYSAPIDTGVDVEALLGPGGLYGDEALQGNQWSNPNYTTPEVKTDWTDALSGYWDKYKKYVNLGLGFAGRTNPYVATALTLGQMFNNPASSIGGMAGGMVGGGLGGAVAGSAGSVLGGMAGSSVGASAAGNAANKVGTTSYGDLGSVLGSSWNYYNTSNNLSNQASSLASLYGQDSSYAQALRANLARADAARGRRSQVGAREVELQAKLADLASRNAATTASITKDAASEKAKMYQNLAYLGKGLYDIF